MNLRFEDTTWLLLALLAIPLAWVALRWFQSMSRARAWSSVVLRGALLLILAAMLAGAATVRETNRLAVIGVVDVSESVRRFADLGRDASGARRESLEVVREWFARAADERGTDDLFGLVAFDGEAMAVLAPRVGGRGTGQYSVEDAPLDVRIREGTDIAAGIRLASAMFPPDAARRLVLVSDGNQTEGDALSAARESARAEAGGTIPIDVLPITSAVRRETMLEFVDSPPRAASESTIAVRVGLRSTTDETSGVLRLFREGQAVDLNGEAAGTGRRISWSGERYVESIDVRLDETPIHRFEAFFEPDDPGADTLADNNRGQAFTVTPGRGRVLLVDGAGEGAPEGAAAPLVNALRETGIEVELVPPAAIPSDLLSMHAYDLVMFNNVAADETPRSAQGLLADYVEQLGGGFVMIGGPDSFGAGGWNGTPLEEILPVRLDLPEQLIMPSAAIMIVLDASGSMGWTVLGGSRTQQDIANEGAALAIETLDESDLVGVIAFSNRHRTVVPLGPNTDSGRNASLVRGISSDGGTNLYPALDEAGTALRGVDAQIKHVIVLSDGRSQGSPEAGVRVAQRMREDGITVSTIAVGDSADTETLRRIASQGGGTYHRVIDPNALPRVFIREVRVVRKPLIREAAFDPVVRATGSPLTAGLGDDWPRLLGLVLTQSREEPNITYAAMAPGGEPLVAHWNVGLGQVAAFTSDANVWARDWLDWPGYRQFWTQVARTIARPATSNRYEMSSEIVDDRLHVRLEAVDDDGEPLDLLTVTGLLYRPGEGEPEEVRLAQTGPGLYEGDAAARDSGAYVVALTPRLGTRQLPAVIGGSTRPRGAEHRRLESDIQTLREIADATGGRLLSFDAPEAAALFDRSEIRPSRASSPIWRLLLAWSFAVLLLDIATRRIAWDRLIGREALEDVRRHAASAVERQGAAAAATMSALRGSATARRGGGDAAATPAARPTRTAATRSAPPPIPVEEDEAPRRQRIRDALRTSQRGAGGGSGKSEATQPEKGAAAEEGGSTTSGLLAAKRRRQQSRPGGDE
ncbi:MAG: VWA domain-containing protein, partial [Planctomycetota bacterium]|nr:VWA domain-containing protein [Planctomycetota bacterium]